MSRKILLIGLVWPEPASSAAGTRILQLVQLFITTGDQVTFASAAAKSPFSFILSDLGVTEQEITLNDHSFNLFVQQLQPDIVVFDRYMTEEQYGWRIRQECPASIRILDTEDLHFLRAARQEAVKAGQHIQDADFYTDTARREIGAILRCDLSLLISETEMEILTGKFSIDPSLIFYLPFLEDELSAAAISQWKSFEQREGFVFIGNYLHEPNWHTLQVLKTSIWPALRKLLPSVNLHIYGAYSGQKVLQLHNPKEKFLVHGRAANAREAIAQHRVMLAPIQFGAGVKGKFIDAMQSGTPSVTTTIGAESMMGNLPWNGVHTDDTAHFISAAAELYQRKDHWREAQQNGVVIINQRYGKKHFSALFITVLRNLSTHLSQHRQKNFIGQILQHNQHNSTKYMSLWIQEKNSKNK